MIIGITGSRSIKDIDYIIKCLNQVILNNESPLTFLTGGAKGVDTIAERYLNKAGYDVICLRPAHSYCPAISYTPLLYIARNQQIVFNCDLLIVIWDGKSKGTKYTFELAKGMEKEVVKFIY